MGSKISKLCIQLTPPKKYVLIVGLEGAGKTTFLYGPLLKPGWEQTHFESTIGYNYEEVRRTSAVIAVFDTPGREALFPIVRNLYKNLDVSGLIFVFKVSNKAIEFIMAKRRLKFLVNEPELKGCALLVIGNVFGYADAQFKEEGYLKNALGFLDIKHIEDNRKSLIVLDAKYSPGESEAAWTWMTDQLEDQN